ncbi:MAG TPA: hypothetical protein VEZ24_18340 [Microvirga sp.]|nr:hypothetical protein [Microvirga sp.]
MLALSLPLLASTMLLAGCADYVERRDTITLHAGEAQAWNKTVHIADPWPPYVMDSHIPGDGQRTAGVIRRYSRSNADAGSGTAAAPPAAGATNP